MKYNGFVSGKLRHVVVSPSVDEQRKSGGRKW